jgi:hypothetical protein
MRILLLLCLVPLLSGQGGVPWNDLRAKNPRDFTTTLRLVNPHPFRQGEIIVAEMKLPDSAPVRTPPPPEHWQFAGILLDPPADCGTLAKPCFLANGDFTGLISGPQAGAEPRAVVLNSYLPPLAPGRYHVAALARKLVLTNRAPGSVSYGYDDPPQYAVSDAIPLEVVAASPEWIRQTLAHCVATLNEGQPSGPTAYQAQHDAAEQLALLNDRAAWSASLDHLPKDEPTLLRGLARGRPAAQVCELMQSRVPAPAQSVSSSYLYSLAEICARANLPPMPVIPAPQSARPVRIHGDFSTIPPVAAPAVAARNPEMQAWSGKQRAYTEGLMRTTTAALATSLAAKQPAAKWEAFATLLQRINQVRNNRPPEPDPAWVPLLTTAFVRDFAGVEPARKQYLLDMYASTVDSPELAPLLETVLDSWKPGDYYEAAHSALRALHRIDPARARVRILAELRKDTTWLDVASLELLPAAVVPAMDDALIEALARAQRPGGWSPQLSMAAIARYATPTALPRIRAIYESQQDSCQPELLAYFVRVDPAYAYHAFHRHTWDMHTMPPPCTIQIFTRTPPLAMNRPLEQYLAAYLMHSDVYIKGTAARMLARYGTPAALPPLWDAFRYFHNYWNGKGDELAQNGQGVSLEVDLRNAIARARGWLVSEADLRTIQSLCISGWCVQETLQDLESIKPPLALEIMQQPLGIVGRVAQYFGLESMAAINAKLAQYPKGTRFVLSGRGIDEIRRFAGEKGFIVTTR